MPDFTTHKSLLELLKYHDSHMKTILKKGTLKNYGTTEIYLNEFLQKEKKVNDLHLNEVNYRFITDFENFLRTYSAKITRKTCGNNGTMKHLERLKKMLNLAVKIGWMTKILLTALSLDSKNMRGSIYPKEISKAFAAN